MASTIVASSSTTRTLRCAPGVVVAVPLWEVCVCSIARP